MMTITVSRIKLLFFIICVSLFLFSSCRLPTITRVNVETDGEEMISLDTETITLEWDHDETDNVASFKLYYRSHGYDLWQELETIDSSIASFEIAHSTIGNGSWDFGVSAIDVEGNESEIHTSLDPEAFPETGWFVLWIRHES